MNHDYHDPYWKIFQKPIHVTWCTLTLNVWHLESQWISLWPNLDSFMASIWKTMAHDQIQFKFQWVTIFQWTFSNSNPTSFQSRPQRTCENFNTPSAPQKGLFNQIWLFFPHKNHFTIFILIDKAKLPNQMLQPGGKLMPSDAVICFGFKKPNSKRTHNPNQDQAHRDWPWRSLCGRCSQHRSCARSSCHCHKPLADVKLILPLFGSWVWFKTSTIIQSNKNKLMNKQKKFRSVKTACKTHLLFIAQTHTHITHMPANTNACQSKSKSRFLTTSKPLFGS